MTIVVFVIVDFHVVVIVVVEIPGEDFLLPLKVLPSSSSSSVSLAVLHRYAVYVRVIDHTQRICTSAYENAAPFSR